MGQPSTTVTDAEIEWRLRAAERPTLHYVCSCI